MKPLLSWSRILKTRSISDGVFLDKPTILKNIFGLKESFASNKREKNAWSVKLSIAHAQKWSPDEKHFLISHWSHTHLLTFASVDCRSDVRVSQKIGDSHGGGGSVATDAGKGDICCHRGARGRHYGCQWIDFIPPWCQKPPAPFCLLSPAADHSEAVCVRPQYWGTLRKVALAGCCVIVNQIDTFAIITVKVNQNNTLIDLHRDGREKASVISPSFCLKLVSPGCKHPVITALAPLRPWLHGYVRLLSPSPRSHLKSGKSSQVWQNNSRASRQTEITHQKSQFTIHYNLLGLILTVDKWLLHLNF